MIFMVLFYAVAMLYLVLIGMALGGEYMLQGSAQEQQKALEEAVFAHYYSPAGIAGMYLLQFLLLFPVVILAANFPQQPWRKTLGFRRFNPLLLKPWLMVFAILLTLEYWITELLDIDVGEFIRIISGSKHFPLALVTIFLAPVLEEAIFRGYLFAAWRQTRLGLSGTLLLTSVLFAGLHAWQYDIVIIVLLFIGSIILGLARERTGTLWVPIILHGINNLVSVITVVYLGWL